MKPISISYALARFVFLSCLTLALLTSVLVVSHVVTSFNRQQETVINREINSISKNFLLFLRHRQTLLREQARAPVMIQTLMQPESNIGKIQDFMADLSILGKKYPQSLLDFQGNILHATEDSHIVDFKQMPWLAGLLSGKSKQYTGVVTIKGQHYWCLAVPISYQQTIEGVLTALLPLHEIYPQAPPDTRFGGLAIEILADQQRLIHFGNQLSGHSHLISWPFSGLSLRFTVDDKAQNRQILILVVQLSLLIIFAIGLTTLLAYFYGYRYFVKPVFMVARATDELDKGEHYLKLKEEFRIKEFSDLFKKFNQMTTQVNLREIALKQSYEQLSKTIEELKQSESQLVQAEKMASLGTLAAGIAHEINNPVGYIKSNLDILQDYAQNLKDYYQAITASQVEEREKHALLAEKFDLDYILGDIAPLLQSSLSGIERVIAIVDSLKTFARTDQPQKSLCDINEGIKATITMAWNELKYHCRLHQEYGNLPKIPAYPGKLNQVFMNLLINAGQAIKDKGEIYIRTYTLNRDIVIEIRDTGRGIKPENIKQIFNPFYTSKPVGQGTGLGLSISQDIILQHSGRIEVSSHPGTGSCFSIYLPIPEDPKPEQATSCPAKTLF
ncbi:sensor histidine kinase [Thalassomonas viridans]|uniref:histidine kinase n=1 Tax=Thalassomonas viridans TaxID=137584 RepID=A0AAE9Z0L6_9GAMM|nr:ATP-binding protein [Thalassomonas viridans]WDE02993.1 sensor histidine kinase [Thalassomonas viridans]